MVIVWSVNFFKFRKIENFESRERERIIIEWWKLDGDGDVGEVGKYMLLLLYYDYINYEMKLRWNLLFLKNFIIIFFV